MENKNSVYLTILYEESFWVADIEKENNMNYFVGKKTFYSEPTDNEIFLFILEEWDNLKLSRPLDNTSNFFINNKMVNPKRKKRIAAKELCNRNSVTKAQLAIKQEHEVLKIEKKKEQKIEKIQNDNLKYQIKLIKKREKHKGK